MWATLGLGSRLGVRGRFRGCILGRWIALLVLLEVVWNDLDQKCVMSCCRFLLVLELLRRRYEIVVGALMQNELVAVL